MDDENKHYLGIIKRNTDRLINIINDLLSLSEMEEKGTKLQLETVNLKELVEQALRCLRTTDTLQKDSISSSLPILICRRCKVIHLNWNRFL